jgi:protein-S-isoprenylcysteine O-methyltransferase Ste14
MIFTQILISSCWAIFIVYWFIRAFDVKQTQKTTLKLGRYRFILIGIVVIFIIVGRLTNFHPFGCHTDILGCHIGLLKLNGTKSLPLQVLSVMFSITGLLIAIIARNTIAGNWSSSIDLKQDHELVTSGIYGYMRHPIYSGVFLMDLGSVVFFQNIELLIISLIVVSFFIYKARLEEKFMTQNFPDSYPDYTKKVKGFIPFIY